MSVTILSALLRANLAGSAAILLILVLRRPARRWCGPLPAYLLWLMAPLSILAGLLPMHVASRAQAPTVVLAAAAGQIAPLARQAPALADLLVAAWAAGVAVCLVLLWTRQARFVRLLGRLSPLEGAPGVFRGEHVGAGPFVLGCLRPRIVTPADFGARFDDEARRLILTHEQVHLERGDAAINGLAALIQCLAWFNPLAHLGATRLRMDQEIACDAAVVARHPQTRRLYAETLLGAALAPLSAPFGCHWPAPSGPPIPLRPPSSKIRSGSRYRTPTLAPWPSPPRPGASPRRCSNAASAWTAGFRPAPCARKASKASARPCCRSPRSSA